MSSSDMLPTAAGKTVLPNYWWHSSSQRPAIQLSWPVSLFGYQTQQMPNSLSPCNLEYAGPQLLDNDKDQRSA